MTQRAADPRIVVGVDGSEASLDALGWAVEEGRRRGATVEVVHAYVPVGHDPYMVPMIDPAFYRDAAERVLDAAMERVATDAHGPNVVRRLVMDGAGPALVELSVGADLVVVSGSGHGHLAEMVLGSVSQYVLHHATCPVVVVPVHRAERLPRAG